MNLAAEFFDDISVGVFGDEDEVGRFDLTQLGEALDSERSMLSQLSHIEKHAEMPCPAGPLAGVGNVLVQLDGIGFVGYRPELSLRRRHILVDLLAGVLDLR